MEANGASPIIVRTSGAREQLSREQQGTTPPDTDSHGAAAGDPADQHTPSRATTPVEPSRVGWTPMGSEVDWAPVETDSWDKFEEAAQQNVQGTTEKAIDYAIDVLGLLQT